MTDIEIELDEQYLADGPVACDDCGEIFPESALTDGLCFGCDDDPLRGLPVDRPCTVRDQAQEICGVICNCGPNGEPLACGYAFGHDGEHSWATLPTFIGRTR